MFLNMQRTLLCIGYLLLLLLLIFCMQQTVYREARHVVRMAPTAQRAHPTAGIEHPHTKAVTSTVETRIHMPVLFGAPPARVLIAAAHIDSAISGEPDEAILLWNAGIGAQPLAGWSIRTKSRTATFPLTSTLRLEPGQRLWCAAEASAFRSSFGETAACEWDEETDPTVLNLDGALQLANGGGWIQLRDAEGALADTLLYGDETDTIDGWSGAPAQAYARGALPRSGQVLQRKWVLNASPMTDSDQASDWAGDLADLQWGRRVRMPGWPGWRDDAFALPSVPMAEAAVTVVVGPEGMYAPLAAAFAAATTSIDLSIYTFEHPEMTQVLIEALQRGVRVRILLEGSPPGGIDDVQRWCLAQLAAAGAEIVYLATVDAAPSGYRARYRYTHAKYGLIDGSLALVGTDNFNRDSMPLPSAEPVGGRRGLYLITDAAPVIADLQRIFAHDWNREHFLDLRPFDVTHERYGGPPADFVLPEPSLWEVADAPFTAPVTTHGAAQFGVISAPENALRPDAGLMALIAQAGAGDAIHLMQLYEHKYWGESASNPVADPNPRLQALIEAARRGAQVRLLLDSFFDDAAALRSNRATVEYIQALAAAEGLDMAARLGNPTAGGIHAKLVLVRLGEARWSAVGSLNGSEVSHKLNREVMLLTDMPGVYERLLAVFAWDGVIQ